MNNRVSVIVLTVFANQNFLTAQTTADVQRSDRIHDVCDVLARPLEYNGRVLTVRDRVSGSDEGAWLSSEKCPATIKSGDHVWPSVIFLAIPSPTDRGRRVPFEFDQTSMTRIEAKYQKLIKDHPSECLIFTYTGLFETRKDWSSWKMRYPDGTWKYAGFGHLGEAPGQLLLRSYDDVSVDRQCESKATGTERRKTNTVQK